MPCEGCTTPCPCPRRSPTCGCACDAACPEAPRALSTEPDRYPIEPKVVPLVFALAELRETQPSWSCEGHVRADGEWIRPPQVWFYAELSVYADLIARHCKSLRERRQVAHLWEVVVSSFSACERTTFVLRPCIEQDEGDAQTTPLDALKQLHEEIEVLAASLRKSVLDQGRARLRDHDGV